MSFNVPILGFRWVHVCKVVIVVEQRSIQAILAICLQAFPGATMCFHRHISQPLCYQQQNIAVKGHHQQVCSVEMTPQ